METTNREQYKGVWVYAEQRGGTLLKVSLELLGEGRRLAECLGVEVSAVIVGDKVECLVADLFAYGADRVYFIEDTTLNDYRTEPYTAAVAAAVNEYKPEILLLGATNNGRDLGPRLAARLKTGLTADCTDLEIDTETRLIQQTRPAFGGNVMATILCPNNRPQMSTVRPGVMKKLTPDASRKGESIRIAYDASGVKVRTVVKEMVEEATALIDLCEAKIIVSGGRGLGDKAGFKVIQEAADKIGAQVGASRAAVDAGWIEHNHQVGQTGKTVSPILYIACGISGAVQHQAGISKSDCIIAINKDPRAAIFNVADYGIVGDLYQVLPLLAEELENIRKR